MYLSGHYQDWVLHEANIHLAYAGPRTAADPHQWGQGFFQWGTLEKKNGDLHPCIDYQGLNEITIKDC